MGHTAVRRATRISWNDSARHCQVSQPQGLIQDNFWFFRKGEEIKIYSQNSKGGSCCRGLEGGGVGLGTRLRLGLGHITMLGSSN